MNKTKNEELQYQKDIQELNEWCKLLNIPVQKFFDMSDEELKSQIKKMYSVYDENVNQNNSDSCCCCSSKDKPCNNNKEGIINRIRGGQNSLCDCCCFCDERRSILKYMSLNQIGANQKGKSRHSFAKKVESVYGPKGAVLSSTPCREFSHRYFFKTTRPNQLRKKLINKPKTDAMCDSNPKNFIFSADSTGLSVNNLSANLSMQMYPVGQSRYSFATKDESVYRPKGDVHSSTPYDYSYSDLDFSLNKSSRSLDEEEEAYNRFVTAADTRNLCEGFERAKSEKGIQSDRFLFRLD